MTEQQTLCYKSLSYWIHHVEQDLLILETCISQTSRQKWLDETRIDLNFLKRRIEWVKEEFESM